MINESESPGKFFSDEFKDWSDAVLDEIGLTQEDITPQCCKDIYLYLVNYTQD